MKKFVALALSVIMMLSLAACGSKAETPAAQGTPAAGNKVVKIGVFEPQTGDNGAGGKQEILGMQYANVVQPTVEIGGETYDVQLEIVDNRTTPENGKSAASEPMNRGVSVVLG
ncbi:MAG: amino acid ABC transporter substrate-binding protein, partial [Oscillospiraceae bacterium]|nr:amino acid ABC transporter substrate-binding protein [Oscillospiraceae bacterium]